MSITSFNTQFIGQQGFLPQQVSLSCTDSLDTIVQSGYLNGLLRSGFTIVDGALLFITYAGPTTGIFTATVSGNVIDLALLPTKLVGAVGDFVTIGSGNSLTDSGFSPSNASDTTVVMAGGSITTGHFSVFADSNGSVEDSGYLPSNAAKTNVVMATAATVVGNIAAFTDTAGTIGDIAASATVAGTGAGQAGATTNCDAGFVIPITIGTTTYFIPLFATN